MTLREFIKENREEIDIAIRNKLPGARIDDRERKLWVLNDEGLYHWAKESGVRI